MICTVIHNRTFENILGVLERCEMAEIRLDSCRLTSRQMDELFSSDVPLVATCRISEVMKNDPSLQDDSMTVASREIKAAQIAEKRLCQAIEAGARYVDVEIEAPKQMSKRVRNAAHENGTVFIRSCHDFEGTPSLDALRALVVKCHYHGADMVKIATMANSADDVERVLSLYDWCSDMQGTDMADLADGGLIAFCMGEEGRESRLECLRCGAPFTYAALDEDAAAGGEGIVDAASAVCVSECDSVCGPVGSPEVVGGQVVSGGPVAAGQWSASEMASAIYGDFCFVGDTFHAFAEKPWKVPLGEARPSALMLGNCGRYPQDSSQHDCQDVDIPLQMPCSKSFAQRAIIIAALADGVSHLKGYTSCGDNEAALSVARALGADVQQEGNMLEIKGVGASLGSVGDLLRCDWNDATSLRAERGNTMAQDERTHGHDSLHVGESGLLARMMIPLMAQLHEGPVEITGEKTLLERPLTGAREILETFGCKILHCVQDDKMLAQDDIVKSQADKVRPHYYTVESPSDGAIRIPLTLCGPLRSGGRAVISGKHGSQLITGLLMALPFAEKNTTLVVNDPKSIPYMFITLEVLKKFGVKIGNEMLGGRDFLESDGDWSLCTEMHFKVRGGQRFKAADIDLEGDWSAAANFLVAGAVFGKAEVAGLDTTSLQADLSIMDILMDAGASLSQIDGAKGNIAVQRAPLRAFSVDASNCPDLFPIISVLAAFCQGTSRIAGLERLANKESDRATAICDMLVQMGVDVQRNGDELVIRGYSLAQRLLARQTNGSGSTGRGDGMTGHECGQTVRECEPATCGDGPRTSESGAPGLLRGGEYTSHHDHRMVMALKVAALGADSPIVIDDEDCVAKSFPSFNEQFALLQNVTR